MKAYEKEKLEKRLITLIYGDSSDDTSGLSLVQLREKKFEFPVEYESRKARFYKTLWEYEDCLYSKAFVGEKAYDEINKFITRQWEKFIPDLDLKMEFSLRYIRTSLSRIINRYRINNNAEGLDYNNPDYTGSKADRATVVENYAPVEQDYELPLRELFHTIQEKFSKCQDRSGKNTKRYLSALITYRLIRERKREGKLDMLFFDVMSEYEFCDLFVLEECRNVFNEGSKLPKQKDVAARFVRGSTGNERKGDDAARYLKPFVKIIKEMKVKSQKELSKS